MKRFWAVLLTLAICLAALPSLAATTKALDAAPLAADTASRTTEPSASGCRRWRGSATP